jgi:pimeloyl-ACP methyl ester carboxylesterase
MSITPRQRFVQCVTPSGLHRLGYLEWGDPDDDRVVVCVHGLTRCARDFDFLARRLARDHRVVCPDMPGRGASGWLVNAMEYAAPTYVADCVTLIARLDVEAVDWVGTSMGGLIGMALASLPATPIKRLVLNDAGPVVTAVSLERIGTYVGTAPRFPSIEAAEQYVRMVSAPFGPHTDDEWRFLTENVVRPDPAGGFVMHYDPALAVPFNATRPHEDMVLWSMYDAIRVPTLVLRGAESDLLTADTARQMTARGPQAKLVEFAGVGHAPTLLKDDQIEPIVQFLQR